MAIAFLHMPGIAQNKGDSLPYLFSQYQQQALQEKLFVHTDKTFYVAGEIIWFKLYNTDGYLHRPLLLNKVAYVEVITADKKSVLQAKIALNNGSGNGSFQLPFSIVSGTYTLRAYTSWMKNAGADYFFEKSITIVNTQKRPDWQKLEIPPAAAVQFFPEGGNLVQGLSSVVGFKVTDEYGRGIDGDGVLLDGAGDTVQRFRTMRFGMGRFSFTPQKGREYKAIVVLANGMRISKSLPHAFEAGYVMHLSEPDETNLQVTIKASESGAAVSLLVHTRSLVKVVEQKTLQNGKAIFILDKNNLGEGISHLTLFTNAGQPVCERLYFKPPEQKLFINVSADQAAYGVRKKVRLSINAKTLLNTPAASDLSLSVFRMDSLQQEDFVDINTYLWLTSELRGRIESADYYIKNKDAEAKDAMENLLLTQGWRRFRWEEILEKQEPSFPFPPEYEGHTIQAKVLNKNTGAPVAGVTAYLSVPGDRFWLGSATTNDSGLLLFALNRFYSNGDVIVQTANAADSIYRIEIQNPFSEQFSNAIPAPFPVSERWKKLLGEQGLGAQAGNAFLKDKLERYTIPANGDTTAFYGRPDATYWLDDFTRFTTMEEVMREYVPEVRVRRQGDRFHYAVKNTPYKNYFDDDPLVLLDGVPVSNLAKIMALDPLRLKKLDVVARRYFLGNRALNGIVSYTTYEGDLAGLELSKNAVVSEYIGLQAQREFYSPVYESAQQTNSRIPDLRRLLYWSPAVQTDASGNATISFYTSDLPGNYSVKVHGLSSNGAAASAATILTVTK